MSKPDAPPPQTLPAWIAQLVANPVQTLSLIGVLVLGSAQGVDAVKGDDMALALEAEIARRDALDAELEATNAVRDTAQECLDSTADIKADTDAIKSDLAKLASDLETRTDENFAFVGELAQYTQRVSERALKSQAPPTGPRLDEYVRKSLMRGFRNDGGSR